MTDFPFADVVQAGGVLAFAYLIWRQQIRIADAIVAMGERLAVIEDRGREPTGRHPAGGE